MGKASILTGYVSEIDQFLQKFDREHPELSKSQVAEIAKSERIGNLRDIVERQEEVCNPLDNF